MSWIHRTSALILAMSMLIMGKLPGFTTGAKHGSITGEGIVFTDTFTLSNPASRALKTSIQVRLNPGASYRTVSLTTTLQKRNLDGSYSNVTNFSFTEQLAGISNTTDKYQYFPGKYTYKHSMTGSTMLAASTFRYKEFARSTVADKEYVTSYSSSLN